MFQDLKAEPIGAFEGEEDKGGVLESGQRFVAIGGRDEKRCRVGSGV